MTYTHSYFQIYKPVFKIKIFCLIILFYFTTASAQYQNYRFESLTSDDGLSQNTVLCIYQDSRNFLWMGTYDGLNRYDGYNFTIYKTDQKNPLSISGQMFTSIVEDTNGNLWIASLGGGLNKYDRMKENFIKYLPKPGIKNSIISNRIRALYIDRTGLLWIGTEEGLCSYNIKKNIFKDYREILSFPNYPGSNAILSFCEDTIGNLWIGTSNGLIKFNTKTNNSLLYSTSITNPNSLSSGYISKLYFDKKNVLWVGTSEGINRYNLTNDDFTRFYDANISSISDMFVRDILEDSFGNLWIATFSRGLNLFDREKKIFINYSYNPYNKESLNSDVLFSLFQDNTGILWIGTGGGGVNKLNFPKIRFRHFKNEPAKPGSLSSNKIQSIMEDKDGIIWVGTYNGGLNKFNRKLGIDDFSKFLHNSKLPNSLIDNKILSVCEGNNDEIWVGTEYGISVYEKRKNIFRNYATGNNFGLSNNSIFSIVKSKTGEILIGTYGGGLNIYNPKTDKFHSLTNVPNNVNSIGSNIARVVFEDNNGIIWIGTEGKGLDRFDRKNNIFNHYRNNPDNKNSIATNNIIAIYEDKNYNLWIGTIQGLSKVLRKTPGDTNLVFKNYSIEEGLPDNNVQSIIEDNYGIFWIGTNKGISKFNPVKEYFENYDVHDGLQSNEFYVNSVCKLKSTGELLFGGARGFNMFKPEEIKRDSHVPPVVLTEFRLFNNIIPAGKSFDGNIILSQSITETDSIKLSYQQNTISFAFSALDYSSPEKNIYAFKMEGLEDKWNYVGNRNYANYFNLPPGKYVFRVKATNRNGIWNENGISLRVIITPPFWNTWWFGVCTFIVFVSSFFSLYKIKMWNVEKRRHELEGLINEKTILNEQLTVENQERKLAEEELRIAKNKAEQSEKLKTEFLAQMSHEIRSPINTIFNFTELIKSNLNLENDTETKESFESIERAGDRIVRTIDMILNMSELQTGSYECIYKELDINTILERICPEFAYKASQKKLNLILNTDKNNLTVIADEYSIVQIFVNIIDNAIKYTQEGIVSITSTLEYDGKINVKISDTGIGISEEYLTNIFTPFYQEEQGYSRKFDGNGLGLALVKKYCEMNNANIFVESEKGVGTIFTLTFSRTENKNNSSL